MEFSVFSLYEILFNHLFIVKNVKKFKWYNIAESHDDLIFSLLLWVYDIYHVLDINFDLFLLQVRVA